MALLGEGLPIPGGPRVGTLRRLLVVASTSALLAVRLAFPADGAGAEAPTEWEVKAAYLYNFARFVEWPEDPDVAPDRPFVVGVLGRDPFGRVLDDTLSGKSLAGRPIVVRRLEKPEDANTVQILFLSPSVIGALPLILRATQGRPVLTVGDSEGLAERGVILNFRLQDNRVRFEVNLRRADEAHLRISSQLLKLAVAVERGS
jgi:hypothetical protein